MVLLWFFKTCDRHNHRQAMAINKVLETIRNSKIKYLDLMNSPFIIVSYKWLKIKV